MVSNLRKNDGQTSRRGSLTSSKKKPTQGSSKQRNRQSHSIKILMLAPHTASFLNFRKDLALEIIKNDCEVILAAPEHNKDNRRELEKIGIKYHPINLDKNSLNPFASVAYQQQLIQIIQEEKPDKIFAYTSKPVIFGSYAAHSCGVREMYSLICGLGSVYASASVKNKILQTIMGGLYTRAFKYNKQVIFQNQDDIDEFVRRKYLPRNKCVLVNGSGVDMERFKQAPLPKQPSFIMVSRIIREKGVQEYFQAAELVKQKYPQVKFTYIGDYDKSYDKDFKKLKSYIDSGIVEYIPTTSRVPDYLAAAQVFVLPSYYREGIPRTLLEALSVGRPIITTDTPGCRETIANGKNGLFAKTRDAKDLADKMIWMIENQQKLSSMGKVSHQLCQEKFAIETINHEMLDMLDITSGANKTIRILQVMGGMDCGGAENFIMNIYRNIDRDKVQFDFVVHNNKKGFFGPEVEKLGGKIYFMPRHRGYNHLSYKKAWKKFFREHPEYKIVHCHIRSTASIVAKIARQYNRTTISHSHSTSNGKGLASFAKRMLQSRITRYADYYFACSPDSARWLFGAKANSSRCFIINNAIDADKYKYNINKRKKTREKLHLKDEVAIVQVGRLYDIKNHLFTLDIIKEISPRINCQLFILGNGPLEDRLKSRAKELGISERVAFMGIRSDVSDILQAMDIFVMPSLYEGLPLSLVEAQAASLPCIISDRISAGILNEPLVTTLPLDNLKEWADAVIQHARKRTRYDQSALVVNAGFDVKSNATWLQEFYANLYKEEGLCTS